MIERINDGDYKAAAKEIIDVEDWKFDASDQKSYVSIENALSFIALVEDRYDKLFPKHMSQYLTKECEVYFNNLYSHGKLNEAALYVDTIVKIGQIYVQREPEANARSINKIGDMYYKVGNYTLAEQYYLQALEINKDLWGENHPSYANPLSSLGNLYDKMDKDSLAEQCFLRALEIDKNYRGENHRNYAITLTNLGNLYYKNGKDSLSEQCYLQALEIRKNQLHEKPKNYATILNNLGSLYYKCGNDSLAEQCYLQALEIRKNSKGENHPEYAKTLNSLGNLYYKVGDYTQAEQCYIKVLSIRKNSIGVDHPDYASTLCNLGNLYYHNGNDSLAKMYYLQVLKKRNGSLDKNQPNKADILNNIGNLYYKCGNDSLAEQCYLQALEIRKNSKEVNSPEYANTLNNLGNLYSKIGNYTQAEQYYIKALEIRGKTIGENHLEYANTLNNLGNLYSKINYYSQSEKCYLQVLEIRKANLGEGHSDYANTLNNLGNLYSKIGNYSQAEKCYLQVLEIRKANLGESHPEYANALNNLGNLYSKKGDYSQAETCYLQVLEIRKNSLGENHPEYATSLNNLGWLYNKIGDYSKAESYNLQALKIRNNRLEDNPSDYVLSINSLGGYYHETGNYLLAEKYYLQALEICRNNLGENHPDCAVSLNNLGSLYSDIGKFSQAEQCYLQALEIRKNSKGVNHPEYANTLNNLGNLYYKVGNYTQAEQYYIKALEIRKKSLGERHPDYANTLSSLGNLYYVIGNYTHAEQCYLQALKIKKSILGENHPNYVTSLCNLGNLYSKTRKYSKAEIYYTKAHNITKNRFLMSLDFMSESQRELYWGTMKDRYEYSYPNFIYNYSRLNSNISAFAFDNELFTKGLLLSSSNNVRFSILESGDSVLIRQWNELAEKKQQISLYEDNYSMSESVEVLLEEAEQLEKQITTSSAEFRKNREQWSVSWKDVRNHLENNQVAIEFFRAPLTEDSAMYCALLLRKGSEYPKFIPLFDEHEVSTQILTTSQSLTNHTYGFEDSGGKLSSLVWSNILPHIRPGEIIFFAPSGLLHQLAIEALPFDSTHTMTDIFNIVRLSSTREIVSRKDVETPGSAALFGGIQYSMSNEEFIVESGRYAGTNLLASRGIEDESVDRGIVRFLSGTKVEVEKISRILKDNHLQVQLYTATTASEESFKALSGKHQNILHIATHGFYWTDSTAMTKDYFTQHMVQSGDDLYNAPGINPLNRCGILFAGANTAWSGHSSELPEGVQDGVLTAKEISLLDLRNADLVVLSACETGKGEITGDEVFGLQRAFKQAGAQSIIMSLWPVDDDATQLLMTEFYNNWINKHQTKHEAFRNAQNTVRNLYIKPSFWAGFVMLD